MVGNYRGRHLRHLSGSQVRFYLAGKPRRAPHGVTRRLFLPWHYPGARLQAQEHRQYRRNQPAHPGHPAQTIRRRITQRSEQPTSVIVPLKPTSSVASGYSSVPARRRCTLHRAASSSSRLRISLGHEISLKVSEFPPASMCFEHFDRPAGYQGSQHFSDADDIRRRTAPPSDCLTSAWPAVPRTRIVRSSPELRGK